MLIYGIAGEGFLAFTHGKAVLQADWSLANLNVCHIKADVFDSWTECGLLWE